MTYDGVFLAMTLTDTLTSATYGYMWPLDIPAKIAGTSAYVGFTGATGVQSSTAATITAWRYLAGTPPPNYLTALFQPFVGTGFFTGGFLNLANLLFDGSAVYQYSADSFGDEAVQLTEGAANQAGTAYVGFTGATGGIASSDSVISWTYVPGVP